MYVSNSVFSNQQVDSLTTFAQNIIDSFGKEKVEQLLAFLAIQHEREVFNYKYDSSPENYELFDKYFHGWKEILTERSRKYFRNTLGCDGASSYLCMLEMSLYENLM